MIQDISPGAVSAMAACDLFKLNGSINLSQQEVAQKIWALENREAMYKLPAIIIIGIVLLVGFLGNLLVCIVYHLKFTPCTSKYFIMSLAIFDLLSCTIALPGEIVDLRFDYHFNFPTVCRLMRFTITLSTCASVTLLLAIAVDRYRKICRPFDTQMNLKETKLWICFAVVVGVCNALPAIPLYGRKSNVIAGVATSDCSFDQKYRGNLFPVIYLGVTGVLCLVCFVLLIVLYILIVVKVWKQRQKRKRMLALKGKSNVTSSTGSLSETNKKMKNLLQPNEKAMEPGMTMNYSSFDLRTLTPEAKERSKAHQKQTMKTTVMLFLVTVVFIISFIPHLILQILSNTLPGYVTSVHCNPASLAAYKLFLRSYFINCASNPIIYSFCNDKFRTECNALLRKPFFKSRYCECKK